MVRGMALGPRGGAEMKSGIRRCCEVRLGIVTEDVAQRMSRQRGSDQSSLGEGSSSTLCMSCFQL